MVLYIVHLTVHLDDRFGCIEQVAVASSVAHKRQSCLNSGWAIYRKELCILLHDIPYECPQLILVRVNVAAELLLHAPHGGKRILKSLLP